MTNKLVYLDNNSTTSVDKRVLDSMIPFFTDFYGNPSSLHNFGSSINKEVLAAKTKIANLINADADDVFLVSGATESINIALKGLALHPSNKKRHLITCQTEHKAVLDTCKYLESVGFEIDYLSVERNGLINTNQLSSLLRIDTLMVCVMWVNNETGVIQPIEEIARISHEYGAYFVCDATQAVGKLNIDFKNSDIDLISFSAHKMYGPKGIGALCLNSKSVKTTQMLTLQHGGGHERGLRSGTTNVPNVVGFGTTCEILKDEMDELSKRIEILRLYLEEELLKINGCIINCLESPRACNTINVYIPKFELDIFLGLNREIAISNGSACNSSLLEPSHVLLAMGLSNEEAMNSFRISLGKNNTLEEIEYFIERLKKFIN